MINPTLAILNITSKRLFLGDFELHAGKTINVFSLEELGATTADINNAITAGLISVTDLISGAVSGGPNDGGNAGGIAKLARKTVTLTSTDGNPVRSIALLGKAAQILGVSSTAGCRLRLYATAAARNADTARIVGGSYTGNGLQMDYLTATGALSAIMAPVPMVFNFEGSTGIFYSLDPTVVAPTSFTIIYFEIE